MADESKTNLTEDGKYRLTPNYGRIGVALLKREAITKGGIIIPDAFQGRTCLGVVRYVSERDDSDLGDEDSLDDGATQYSLGDHVIIGQFVGTGITIGRDEYILIIRESDVLAKLEPTDPNGVVGADATEVKARIDYGEI